MLLRSDPFADLFSAPRSAEPSLASMNAYRHGDVITVWRSLDGATSMLVLAFGREPVALPLAGRWLVAFDADDRRWGGAGATSVTPGTLRSGSPNALLLDSVE